MHSFIFIHPQSTSHSNPVRTTLRYVALLCFATVVCAAGAATDPAPAALPVQIGEPTTPRGNAQLLSKLENILKYGDLVGVAKPAKGDAVIALGLLGDEAAVPLLLEHLEHEDNNHLRLQIVRALGWIGSPSSVSGLENALHDRYPLVRKQAAAVLSTITGHEYPYDKTGLPSPTKLLDAVRAAADSSQ